MSAVMSEGLPMDRMICWKVVEMHRIFCKIPSGDEGSFRSYK